MDHLELRRSLRMPIETYNDLLERVRPNITLRDTHFRRAITADERLALTIRYLALGDNTLSLSQQFRVGYCSVGRIVRHTCQAIYDSLRDEYLHCPSTREEWEAIALGFERRWNLVRCVGALDGKHVRIVKPPNSGSAYYNYKKFFSIVLMAAVDFNYEFMWVEVGSEGSASDSTIWRQSSLLRALNDPANPLQLPPAAHVAGLTRPLRPFFVADDAFALTPSLMKPFGQTNMTVRQRIFNYRISRARMVVENAFGILSTRFRIFRREIEMRPRNAEIVVLASCVLHNFLRRSCGENYMPRAAIDHEDQEYERIAGQWREEEPLVSTADQRAYNATKHAKEIREDLANFFISPAGEFVPQYEKIGNF